MVVEAGHHSSYNEQTDLIDLVVVQLLRLFVPMNSSGHGRVTMVAVCHLGTLLGSGIGKSAHISIFITCNKANACINHKRWSCNRGVTECPDWDISSKTLLVHMRLNPTLSNKDQNNVGYMVGYRENRSKSSCCPKYYAFLRRLEEGVSSCMAWSIGVCFFNS